MLNQFTWQEFVTVVLLAGIAYYGIASFLLFRKEIIAFFNSKRVQVAHTDVHPEPSIAASVPENNPVITPAPAQAPIAVPESVAETALEEPIDFEEVTYSQNSQYVYSGEDLPEDKQPPLEIVVEDEPENGTSRDTGLIIGVVSDLLSEMKSLFLVCAENKTARLEVLRFIRLLLRRYVSLYQSEYKESISLYIYHTWNEHLSHQVDPTEIAQCWLPSKPE
jgi:hypothetical protein